MEFREALGLNDEAFARYAEECNREYRRRMIAEGMVWFPSINRRFPAGTEIAGCEPEVNP